MNHFYLGNRELNNVFLILANGNRLRHDAYCTNNFITDDQRVHI